MHDFVSRLGKTLVLAMLLALAQPQFAALASDSAAKPAARPEAATTMVTLITGDQIQLAAAGDGRTTVTIVPSEDGTRSNAKVVEHDDNLYVLPLDAMPYLAAGSLDRELFNVTRLAAQADIAELPLIVTYSDAPTARTLARRPTPPHRTRSATLESIDAVAVRTPKEEAAAFWASVRTELPTAGDEAATIEKVWLDLPVRAELSDSVPQIGAPEAWAAGYDGAGVTVAVLDTGYDPTHPDLAGRVDAHADFTGGGDAVDRHGHGTHVAATIAGSGDASGGDRVGVAPGADLLVGKVLGDGGTGDLSSVIDGMEWAAAQDADIVNMSLSADTVGSSDPLTEAVDTLTRTTGTLFVAAAGNTGPSQRTVRTPGTADSALSVGAVDKADQLADFSSRGPRPGDHALKPDITAPGVDIVAARAAGTSLGSPLDAHYTALSGTSMATPHVAGAAAILAQQHPEWGPAELKHALISTARTSDEYDVYQQGGGRVDIARAVAQAVYAGPGTISFGTYDGAASGTLPTVTRTITYSNDSDDAVTLDLRVDVSGQLTDAPAGLFELSTDALSVPANGTAEVEVTLDPNLGDPDLYGGYVVATSGDGLVVLHTSIGTYKQPPMVDLVIDAIAPDGGGPAPGSSVDLWNLDTDGWETGFFGGKGGPGPAVLRVPAGTYSMMAFIFMADESGRAALEVAVAGEPQIEITESMTLTLDASDASPIDVHTPWPTEQRGLTIGYYRESERHSFNLRYLLDRYMNAAYATTTEPVDRGSFEFTTQWELFAPEFSLRALAPTEQPLDAEYVIGSPRIDGRHVFDVADAGTASGADLAGADLTGKLALIRRSDDLPMDSQVRAVADAGARAALIYHDQPGWLLGEVSPGSPIPSFTARQADGERFLARLASDGRLRIEVQGTAVSPYVYDLMFAEPGRIPGELTYDATHESLAKLDTRFATSVGPHFGAESRFAFRPYDNFAIRLPRDVPLPSRRTEWVSPGDTSWRQVVWPVFLTGGMAEALRTYEAGEIDPRTWFAPVVRPGVPDDTEYYGDSGLPGYRQRDVFTIAIRDFLDSDGHWANADGTDGSQARLYRDGVLVATRDGVYGSWPAHPQPAAYRLELDVGRSAWWWRHSSTTRTAWTFTSQRPADGERAMLGLLQVDYEVDTGLTAEAKASAPTRLRLKVHRQGDRVTGEQYELRLWASYDSGKSWHQVDETTRIGPGEFAATLHHPAGAGDLSLRVEASDRDGNSIEQTIERAVMLASR